MDRGDLEWWTSACLDALEEVTTTALDSDFERGEDVEQPPPPSVGAYISLASPTESLQLSLMTDDAGCRQLVARMMMMDPEDADDLDPTEVADAIGEICNIWAGVAKTRLADRTPGDFALGFPMFVQGRCESPSGVTRQSIRVELGDVTAVVGVARHRTPRAAA